MNATFTVLILFEKKTGRQWTMKWLRCSGCEKDDWTLECDGINAQFVCENHFLVRYSLKKCLELETL